VTGALFDKFEESVKKLAKRLLVLLQFLILGVLPNFTSIAYAQMPSFDGVIVFSRDNTHKERTIEIATLDGKGLQEHKLIKTGYSLFPKISPDGKYILFESHRPETKNTEVYLVDIDGKNERRLTFTQGGSSRRPHWGSSVDVIYFETTIRGNLREYKVDVKRNKLLLIHGDVDGSDIVQVRDIKTSVDELDKKAVPRLKVVIAKQHEDNHRKYRTIPAPNDKHSLRVYDSTYTVELSDSATGTTKIIGKEHDSGPPAWSKDGNMIAFFSGSLEDTRLWTYDIVKDRYEQYAVPANNRIGCNMPTWGKDSRFIAFSCGTPVSEEDDDWIYIIDLQSRKSSKLIKGGCPDWF
jgi:Tol biopolymer transport system component